MHVAACSWSSVICASDMDFATCLPKLQVSTGELVPPVANIASPFSQENTVWVVWVCYHHPDPNSWAFHAFIWHPIKLREITY